MEGGIMTDIRMSSMAGIPFGNNAGRPTATTGQPYFNGEAGRLELYTGTGWENIVQEVPGVASVSGQYLETNNSNTITIYGTNFVSGATAFAIGTNAVEVAATSTTFNSLVQLTAVFTGLTAANEPYDIKVVNPSNLFGILPDTLFVNNQVTWTTSAGSLGTFADQVSISVSAVASDDSTITYAVASGSTLPSGITLNTATGLLSGTLADVASNTTYTFTLTASDGSNPAVSRQFSILVNAAPVWVTSAGTLGTFVQETSISLSLSATDSSDTVTYALASGSSLPAGVTLNSASGVISGTLPGIQSDTTYTFTINALDGINTIPRTFSITSRVVPVVTGGTLTSDSTYYYRTFTADASLTVSALSLNADILIVAGGGGGGFQVGGGGGGGGYVALSNYLIPVGSSPVVIGAGGAGGSSTRAENGGNSTVTINSVALTAIGGGGGANHTATNNQNNNQGWNGGSGGGGSGDSNQVSELGGTSTQPTTVGGQSGVGFGNSGGQGRHNNWAGGGGGGAGAAGSNSPAPEVGGTGGDGKQWLNGSYYAGGGGGCNNSSSSAVSGGIGGGGSGTGNGGGSVAKNGTPNTGGGGGGVRDTSGNGGTGGSGIVIFRYTKASVGG
jgi:hypothetical protein